MPANNRGNGGEEPYDDGDGDGGGIYILDMDDVVYELTEIKALLERISFNLENHFDNLDEERRQNDVRKRRQEEHGGSNEEEDDDEEEDDGEKEVTPHAKELP